MRLSWFAKSRNRKLPSAATFRTEIIADVPVPERAEYVRFFSRKQVRPAGFAVSPTGTSRKPAGRFVSRGRGGFARALVGFDLPARVQAPPEAPSAQGTPTLCRSGARGAWRGYRRAQPVRGIAGGAPSPPPAACRASGRQAMVADDPAGRARGAAGCPATRPRRPHLVRSIHVADHHRQARPARGRHRGASGECRAPTVFPNPHSACVS